jgi:tRNA threonylcarbamoyl adenosine modification protein YeaZ
MLPTPSVFHLVIHSGYNSVFIGLYDRTQSIDTRTLDKKTVSAFLVPSILDFLTEHTTTFNDLSFIAVHSGPAPFTTLRVGIATANGLGFATHAPIIPVSGLQALSKLYPDYTVLLNAFCDDVYIGKNGVLSCQNIDLFLKQQQETITTPTTYIGNGVTLHYDKIKDALGSMVHIPADYPYEASLDTIAQEAYSKWENKQDLLPQVLPVYLKEYSAKQAQ